MKPGTPESLRAMAEQLREDARDCWGIRRKMNLLSAAKHMEAAADRQFNMMIQTAEVRERIKKWAI